MPHRLIASPYPEGHVVVRPGYDGAVRIGTARYAELRDASPDAPVPGWLRLSPADRTRLLSIAGVPDQIVQLASEQDENLMKGAGSEHKRERTVADADRR